MTNIFFIMPFRPGLNYMYLYIKNYVEQAFPGTRCVRGDSSISTGILINKIRADIEEADVVIADCSGHNPNVFYELGVAHALGKQVLLINGDPDLDVPTDIRAYEQLSYGFDDHENFCSKMTQALQGLLGRRYEDLYIKADTYLKQFCMQRGRSIQAKNKDRFKNDVISKESAKKLPPLDNDRLLATFLLPIIVADEVFDLELATEMKNWVDATYNAT